MTAIQKILDAHKYAPDDQVVELTLGDLRRIYQSLNDTQATPAPKTQKTTKPQKTAQPKASSKAKGPSFEEIESVAESMVGNHGPDPLSVNKIRNLAHGLKNVTNFRLKRVLDAMAKQGKIVQSGTKYVLLPVGRYNGTATSDQVSAGS